MPALIEKHVIPAKWPVGKVPIVVPGLGFRKARIAT